MAELWNDIISTDVMQSEGFVVDYAVMTTYSLDLPTLLSVPFSLGAMSDLTDAAMHSPHLILEAVNSAVGKFAVFCNAGSIAVPQSGNKIYTLLENSVVQISLPAKGNGFVNFHPKVWVIKETNPDTQQSQIKVVVLSRNLTCSNNLDVVCELVGTIRNKPATRKAQEKHKPLGDFLTWLNERSTGKIRKNILSIIADINKIEQFDLEGTPFNGYAFFPMGIDGYDGEEDCLKQNILDHAAEMVVISPFIDSDTLKRMTDCCPKARKTLITQHASITDEIIAMFNDGAYAPKEVLTDKVEKDISVDLHEKVYFVRNYQSCINQLYLGSTNATKNGFGRNVEFLLRLDFKSHKTSYDIFRKELIYDEKDCMFERVDAVSEENVTKEDAANELLLRKAISAIQKADIIESNGAYDITIHCYKTKIPQTDVTIYPLLCDAKEAQLIDGLTFSNMALSMLTEFYVISIGDLKRVIKVNTTGMPVEERDKAIFRSIINTKGKFISYLAFMLSDDVEQYLAESDQIEKALQGKEISVKEQELSLSLYESMVKMAYNDPDRLKSIHSLIEKVDASVIPDSFADMYNTFEKAIKQVRNL